MVVGAPRAGKTLMVKAIVKRLKERGVKQITVLDPSLAWWSDAPLTYRKICRLVKETDFKVHQYDCVCDVSKFIGDERSDVIRTPIEDEYVERVDKRRVSGCTPTSFPLNVTVIEEAQTIFKKFGIPGTRIYDWVSMGMNFNMTGVYTTQRPAEVPTEIVERCNLLIGYIDGHRNMQKIRGAVKNMEFMRNVLKTKQGSHEFMYYDGGTGFKVKVEDVHYGEPKTILPARLLLPNLGEAPQNPQKGIPSWWWIAAILLILAVAEIIW